MFCNAYQSLNDGAAQWVTMDLFYTDPGGLILEHWDTIAPYVAVTRSGTDMVRGATDIDMGADTLANKALLLEYTKQVLQEGDHAKLDQFVSVDIVEHASSIGAGRAGVADWLGSNEAGRYDMLFQLIGQGDFVVTYGKRHAEGKEIAVFDVYRLADGVIVEHW